MMNSGTDRDHETPREEQREQWIDSLLHALSDDSTQHAQSLVTCGFDRIDETESSRTLPLPQRSAWWKPALLVAAVIVVAAIFMPIVKTSTALAAVTRSLEQSFADTGRHYSLRGIQMLRGERVERNANLYVRGGDRLALRASSSLPARPLWLGSDGETSWVVPPIGPVLQGDRESLRSWVTGREEMPTPFLHISTILERMRDSFDLEERASVTLGRADGTDVMCRHITGSKNPRRGAELPDRIELWTDSRSGVAIRVELRWDRDDRDGDDGEARRESITLELIEERDLPDAFFRPEEHGGAERPRIDFGALPARR